MHLTFHLLWNRDFVQSRRASLISCFFDEIENLYIVVVDVWGIMHFLALNHIFSLFFGVERMIVAMKRPH
jgi:hypothetical protein